MEDIPLDRLDLAELQKLHRDVTAAILRLEQRRKQEARAALDSTAKEFGFSLSELIDDARRGKRPPVPPKYINPDDPAQTWSGRGRRPRWVNAALGAGRPLEELEL